MHIWSRPYFTEDGTGASLSTRAFDIVEDSAIEWLLRVHEIQSVLSLWGGLLLLLKRVFTLHGWLTSKLAPITHKAVRQADIIQ